MGGAFLLDCAPHEPITKNSTYWHCCIVCFSMHGKVFIWHTVTMYLYTRINIQCTFNRWTSPYSLGWLALWCLAPLSTDFPKLAEKLSVIRTDRQENLVRPKYILPVRKKNPKKFTVTCIMFSLAFLRVIYPSISNWAPDFTSGFYRG